MSARPYSDGVLHRFVGMSVEGNHFQPFHLREGNLLKWIIETGNDQMRDDVWLVPDVCRCPSSIWEDIGGYVYAGYPAFDFARQHGQQVFDLPTGFLFLVYLTYDYEVTFFDWGRSASHNGRYPQVLVDSQGKVLWELS